ncbi:hypothetical protein TthAK1_19180 [Thermus thermophilus]|uniref:YfjI family protein n=1 Tax=Thermus thermophilus TaxID=274 RepID=UPI001C77A587|nr:YfjI family protein [Thermus thermophilus]BCZ95301.1 hypothetical protein TthAK1_19180 [Thermus thermophilus]
MVKANFLADLERLKKPIPFSPEGLPEPAPLEELGEEELPPFPGEILPGELEAFLRPFAERLAVEYGAVAITALGLASGLLAGRYVVQPDPQNPTWREGVNLWVAVISDPGTKKTPILKTLAEPLYELEAHFQEEYEERRRTYELERQAWQASKPQERGPEPQEPRAFRVLVEDATKEALAQVLKENRGVVAVYDELKGLFSTWQRVDRQADRAFYLKAHSGGSHREDRMGRKGHFVRDMWLAIVGFIQPGPFRRLLKEAAKGGEEADGLVQRFVMVEGRLLPWKKERPSVPREAQEAYKAFMKGLWQSPEEVPRILRFAPDAQELWYEWEDEVEQEARDPDLPPSWKAYLGKRLLLTARFAGVLSLVWKEGEWVSAESLLRAIELVQWADAHAKRIWRGATRGDYSPANRVAVRILERAREGKLPEQITPKWVWDLGFAGIESVAQAAKVLQRLAEKGWLLEVQPRNRNRGGKAFVLNPKVLEGLKPEELQGA